MNIVAQHDKKWCVAACMESASRDIYTEDSVWTQERINETFEKFFPQPEKTFHSWLIPTVSFHIKLGNFFQRGKGKEYALKYDGLKEITILIITQKDENGGVWGHCLRMGEMTEEGFKALDPSRGAIISYPWDFLSKHDCLIYVIGRTDLSIQK